MTKRRLHASDQIIRRLAETQKLLVRFNSGPDFIAQAIVELPRLDGHLILGETLEEGGPSWVVQRSTRPSSVGRP